MKFFVFIFAVWAVASAEDKKEKRGLLGLGYGHGAIAEPLSYGPSLSLASDFGHGIALSAPIASPVVKTISSPIAYSGYSSPALSYSSPALSYSAPSLAYSAPALSYSAPSLSYSAPALSYSAPALSYSSPLLTKSIGAPIAGPIGAPLLTKSIAAPIAAPISYSAPLITKSYAAPALVSAPLIKSYAAPTLLSAPVIKSYAAPAISAPISLGHGLDLSLGYGKFLH